MRVKLRVDPIAGCHKHHVFYGANRKHSEKWGCVTYLPAHLHTGDTGIHFDKNFDNVVKKIYQKALEEMGWTREEFMETFGRNYL